MSLIQKTLLDGFQGAIVGAATGSIGYYLNKKITPISYINFFHSPDFAKTSLYKTITVISLITAVCAAFQSAMRTNSVQSYFRRKFSEKGIYLNTDDLKKVINTVAVLFSALATMTTLRVAGINGFIANMAVNISLKLVDKYGYKP